MNTKIIVALVIGIALIGLSGAASAYIYTETDIWGTHFTSESSLRVSNFPVTESYQSVMVAEFIEPVFPSVDLSYTEKEISGDTFMELNEVMSTPTGSRTATTISNLDSISGILGEYSCVDIGTGEGPSYYAFPQPIEDPVTFEWSSNHLAGSTYPAEFHVETSIFWP